jgi:hypothetical protein
MSIVLRFLVESRGREDLGCDLRQVSTCQHRKLGLGQ